MSPAPAQADTQDTPKGQFSCACGEMQGVISDEGLKAATRLGCYCSDCRAAELYHNQPDPAPGPVDLLQLSPTAVSFTKGAEHLRLMRLGPKGLFRWYAGCCGTPMFNTLAKQGLPFAGLSTARLRTPEVAGKMRTHAFMPRTGKPLRTKGAAPMVYALIRRMLSDRLSGRWKSTPFFDIETGAPVATPEVISKEQRKKLYP